MSKRDPLKHCKGCALFDPENGCANGTIWQGSTPKDPPCYVPVLIADSRGRSLSFDRESRELIATDDRTGRCIYVSIDDDGLLELAASLIKQALKLREGQP